MTRNRKVTHGGKCVYKKFDRATMKGMMALATRGESHEHTE
jgi:hypothetical protein